MRGIKEIRRINLQLLIDRQYHGSQTQFAEAIGFKQASLVSRLVSDNPSTNKPIGDALARRIETTAGLAQFWLDQEQAEHITAAPRGDYNVLSGPEYFHLAPILSWVQAGDWQEAINAKPLDDEDADAMPCPVPCSDKTFILRVRGASMEPKFHEGEYIFVDPTAEARNRSYVVVRLDDAHEATFKQLILEGGRRYLKALNPSWPGQIIEVNGNATICGVVIFRGEKL